MQPPNQAPAPALPQLTAPFRRVNPDVKGLSHSSGAKPHRSGLASVARCKDCACVTTLITAKGPAPDQGDSPSKVTHPNRHRARAARSPRFKVATLLPKAGIDLQPKDN